MQPLDLLKVQLQVSTANPTSGLGNHIWLSLKAIQQSHGWRGLYRGLVPNIAGNASSWGLYFLLYVSLPHLTLFLIDHSYNMLKKRASDGDLNKPLSAPQYLICSAQASSHSPVYH
jgi:solute carrier family 25 folate transporter 32